MKKVLIFLAALALPFAASAQVNFGVRASAGADVKIQKGLHFNVEEEIRTDSDGLDNLRTSMGVSYKLNKMIKLEAAYTLINPYKASAGYFNYPRHRISAGITGSYKYGDWQFSVRERLMMTHRTGTFNEYQTTRNSVVLRTRVGAKYKGFDKVEPYGYFDLKTVLNDPWGTTSGNLSQTNSGKYYYAYTPGSYNHAYNCRYRINAGADIKLSKKHEFTPFVLLDFCSDYEIDTNSEGSRLFTETTGWNDYTCLSIGLSYKYSF